MNREEAIDKADALVSAWIEQVKNPRGYVHDTWKPADPEARTDAVLRIAEFLTEPTRPPLQAPSVLPDVTTWGGWPIDGSQGPPTLAIYDAARSQLAAWEDQPNRVRLADNVAAVYAVIAAYEAEHRAGGPPRDT